MVAMSGCRLALAICVGEFPLLPGNKDLDGPILLLADRGVMDSTSVRPEVVCMRDRELFSSKNARLSDNKIDNSEDVCQRLRMFLSL